MLKTSRCRFSTRVVFVMVFLGLIVSVYSERGPQYRSIQVNGMGRSGTASVNGPSAMYLNPAGLAGLSGAGFEISGEVGLNGLLLDYAKWANANNDKFDSFDSLLKFMDPAIQNKWATYSEAYFMQGHYKEYAISVVRDSRYNLTLGKAVIAPDIGANMVSDLQIAVGRGFVPAPDWNVGASVKFLNRKQFPQKLLGSTDGEFYSVKHCWEAPASSPLDNRDKVTCASDFAVDEYGFGLNLGVSHPLPKGFSVGASLLDLPTFFNGGFIYPQANIGGSYSMNFAGLTGLNKAFHALEAVSYGLLVNLDWQMPFQMDPWYHQWKAGVGWEALAHNREVGLLSVGLNDGYPSFAVRAGYYLYVYYLYTAEETGDFPGQQKLSFHRFGLDLNF